MTRRNRKEPRPSRVGDALIVISPAPGVVAATASALHDQRELALAKRLVERGLRAGGLPRRKAEIVVARMAPADLLAEANQVRAAAAVPALPPVPPSTWARITAWCRR